MINDKFNQLWIVGVACSGKSVLAQGLHDQIDGCNRGIELLGERCLDLGEILGLIPKTRAAIVEHAALIDFIANFGNVPRLGIFKRDSSALSAFLYETDLSLRIVVLRVSREILEENRDQRRAQERDGCYLQSNPAAEQRQLENNARLIKRAHGRSVSIDFVPIRVRADYSAAADRLAEIAGDLFRERARAVVSDPVLSMVPPRPCLANWQPVGEVTHRPAPLVRSLGRP